MWIATNLTAAQAVEVITDPRSGKSCLGEKYKPVTLNHCEDPLASGQVVILSMKHLKETARGGELADMIGSPAEPGKFGTGSFAGDRASRCRNGSETNDQATSSGQVRREISRAARYRAKAGFRTR